MTINLDCINIHVLLNIYSIKGAMKKKHSRQKAIKELLTKEMISDQNKMVELLKEFYDIDTNQAAVSRDLRKLGVVKKVVNDLLVYDLPTVDIQTEILKLAIIDIVYNEVMIVIKTHPGLADFVGDCLDQFTDLDIIGCLAGENVVFATPKSIKNIAKTAQIIAKKVHFKKQVKQDE